MYNREFFRSKLGKASIASISAMVIFVALSTQMNVYPSVVMAGQYSNLIMA